MEEISKENIINIRVSSVQDRDLKNYGKKNIFDGCPDSCWNSAEGKPQWVSLEFDEPFRISSFAIEFQGGFVGKNCQLLMDANGEAVSEPFYPEDVNGVQKFSLSKPYTTKNMKFLFNDSTDFFGRIVIYSINIFKE